MTEVYNRTGNCFVAVSEGIHDKDGKFISEYGKATAEAKDMFNHTQLGGVCGYLANIVKAKTGAKVRAIEFSLLQRCASHCGSLTDVEEAYEAGKQAVLSAIDGKTGVMMAIERQKSADGKYCSRIIPAELSQVANFEKKLPDEYINEQGNNVTPAFLDYVLPLIQGESRPPFENGVPRFANLKKVKA